MGFGDRLKSAREKKNMSQQDLANKLSITDGTISNYEKGVAFPRWDKIVRLCDILDIDPNYMFWDDLPEKVKANIKQSSSGSETFYSYNQLDTEDRAEIRGEIKQMLKASKYKHEDEPSLRELLEEYRTSMKNKGRIAAYGEGVHTADISTELTQEDIKKFARESQKLNKE